MGFALSSTSMGIATTSSISNPSGIREIPIPQNNSEPVAITTENNGSVWFAETNPAAIATYDPNSTTFVTFPVPTSNESGLIWFLVIDGGDIWFSCENEPLLWSFSMVSYQFSNYTTGNLDILPYSLRSRQ